MRNDWVENWNSPEDSISFDIDVIEDGKYSVRIQLCTEYAAPATFLTMTTVSGKSIGRIDHHFPLRIGAEGDEREEEKN